MATMCSRIESTVSSQPGPCLAVCLLSRQDFHPLDPAVPPIGLSDRTVNHPPGRSPHVRPYPITFYERNDGMVGRFQPRSGLRDFLRHVVTQPLVERLGHQADYTDPSAFRRFVPWDNRGGGRPAPDPSHDGARVGGTGWEAPIEGLGPQCSSQRGSRQVRGGTGLPGRGQERMPAMRSAVQRVITTPTPPAGPWRRPGCPPSPAVP